MLDIKIDICDVISTICTNIKLKPLSFGYNLSRICIKIFVIKCVKNMFAILIWQIIKVTNIGCKNIKN